MKVGPGSVSSFAYIVPPREYPREYYVILYACADKYNKPPTLWEHSPGALITRNTAVPPLQYDHTGASSIFVYWKPYRNERQFHLKFRL